MWEWNPLTSIISEYPEVIPLFSSSSFEELVLHLSLFLLFELWCHSVAMTSLEITKVWVIGISHHD